MIRVLLPYHLQTLAGVGPEVRLEVASPVSAETVLNALEDRYPMLKGTIRDHQTKERRPYLRYFVCREDWSHEPAATPLPEAILQGVEPFRVIGAIAGG